MYIINHYVISTKGPVAVGSVSSLTISQSAQHRAVILNSGIIHPLSFGIASDKAIIVHWTPHHCSLSIVQQDSIRITVIPFHQNVSRSPRTDLSKDGVPHFEAQRIIVDPTRVDTVDQFLSIQITPNEYETAFSFFVLFLRSIASVKWSQFSHRVCARRERTRE